MPTITRKYDHRKYGRIGQATLTAPDGAWTLDGKPLPESSVNHLVNFALQTLQDAYAGAESEIDAGARFEKKRDALLNGTIGVRSGDGSPSDPVGALATRLAIEAITADFVLVAGLKPGVSYKMATIRDNLSKEGKAKLAKYGEFGGKNGNTFTWSQDAVAAFVEANGLRDKAKRQLDEAAKLAESADVASVLARL